MSSGSQGKHHGEGAPSACSPGEGVWASKIVGWGRPNLGYPTLLRRTMRDGEGEKERRLEIPENTAFVLWLECLDKTGFFRKKSAFFLAINKKNPRGDFGSECASAAEVEDGDAGSQHPSRKAKCVEQANNCIHFRPPPSSSLNFRSLTTFLASPAVIDKTADFVARNGPAFEHKILSNEKQSATFSFLLPTDPFHAYYKRRIQELKGLLPGQDGAEVPPQQIINFMLLSP